MANELDMDANYTVKNWRGIAWYVVGYVQIWRPNFWIYEDENGEEFEEEAEDGEFEEDRSKVVCVMVGDDRKHTFDIDDLTLINDLDFCGECGQIGCQHDGRDRSDEEQTAC